MTTTPARSAVRWPFVHLWDTAQTYAEFQAGAAPAHQGLWEAIHRLAKVPSWAPAAADLPAGARLVALSEDWCGDAVNTLPVVAKWAEAAGIPLRILKRDEHPAVMDRYLSEGGARAIPVVVALAGDWQELGWWGSRPAALQAWVKEQRALGRTKQDLYPEIRRWYAKDRGEAVVREVAGLFGVARS